VAIPPAVYGRPVTDDPALLWAKARDCLINGAAVEAERLARLGPDDGPFNLLLGMALDQQGNIPAALGTFRRASQLAPDDPLPGMLEARVLARLGQIAAALARFDELLVRHPGNANLWAEAGTFHLDHTGPTRAVELLRSAISYLAPGQSLATNPHHNLGIALMRLGDLCDAAQAIETAIALAPMAESYDVLAAIKRDMGDFAAFDQLIALRTAQFGPGVAGFGIKAEMAADRGDWAGACQYLAQALCLMPQLGGLCHDLGLGLDMIGHAAAQWHNRAGLLGDARSQAPLRLFQNRPQRGEEICLVRPIKDMGQLVPTPLGHISVTLIKTAVVYADQFYITTDGAISGDLVVTTPIASRDLVTMASSNHRALVELPAQRAHIEAGILIGGTANYYHWMIDDLPRLAALDHLPKDMPVLLNANLQFQMDTLAHLGIDRDRLRPMPAASGLGVSNLLVAHYADMPRQPSGLLDVERQIAWPAALDFLRTTFADWCDGPSGKRIFISRRASSFRCLVNEAEIEAILIQRGFSSVRLEELTIAEQVRLFSQAQAVVGAHGAGFTNLAFAPKETNVLELHPPSPVPSYFTAMSAHLGQTHHTLEGRAVQALRGFRRTFWNFHIDPLTFTRTLDAMGL